ncbi:M48 family metallopeptidase [Idiomarina seosinensis]|uniref:M48 family metallopeptidase n=1 Tax=Idiomarina seosinensis TaxID=281739 RepID=UPI00384D3B52
MQVGGQPVTITRKPIKHLYLRVKAAGDIAVSAPQQWPLSEIKRIIEQRTDWIKKQQQRLSRVAVQSPLPAPVNYSDGSSLAFQGQWFKLSSEACQGRSEVLLSPPHLLLKLGPSATEQSREKLIDNWYRQQLKRRIAALLDYWQPLMQVSASDFGVRKMKTRWGSCNICSKKIWLNFDLIKKAPESLEYVVVHELTHLYERYHNARFYRLMDHYLPDWRARRQRLNCHD